MKLRAAAALLFLGLALGLAFRLGTAPPRHRSEKRSDLIVHEMVASGRWFIPTLGGVARLQKPPLYYWAAAAAAELGGGPSATTLRSVSALSAFALALVLFAWAADALSPERGLVAAATLVATGQFWISARLGTADMLLVLFATSALLAFERLERTREPRWWPVLSGRAGGAVRTHAPPAAPGGPPRATTLRSVSALSAFALAAVLFAWAERALSPEHALAAAAALVATGQFWISARLGTADMLLVLFATSALFAFERLERTREPRWWPVLSALAVLAFLTKATAALVDVAVPVFAWLALERRLGLALRPRALAWTAATACAALAWYVAVLALVPEAPARLREFFFVPLGAGHSDLASDHYHPVWWYLPRFLGAAAPAVLLLPLVIRDGVRTRLYREEPPLRFAALAALSLFAVWSVIPQKGRHYLLPILPFFAVLAADALWRALRRT